MVTADNLNLDVLEIIFAYLSGKDLASVALVSRSFFAGVIPTLYCNLVYRLNHGKRYPQLMTPFASIVSHPGLAVHVKRIEIRDIPTVISTKPYPEFLGDCARALALCTNLTAFVMKGKQLAPLLLSLQNKPRLQSLRVDANQVTKDQAVILAGVTRLRCLCLEFASWCTVDILPTWVGSMCKTLSHLTLYRAVNLNESVLESVLKQLARLLGLHVISCLGVNHVTMLRLVKYTPRLEELSLTAWETSKALPSPKAPLDHLRHLALEIDPTMLPTAGSAATSAILSYIQPSFPPLSTFLLKFCDYSYPTEPAWIKDLLRSYGPSLTRIGFINYPLDVDAITEICNSCLGLETLEVALPSDVTSFTSAIAELSTLRTLIDQTEIHTTHGPRPALTRGRVRYMMEMSHLETIVGDNRVWMGTRDCDYFLHISLLRRRHPPTHHWFLPRE